MAKKEFTIHVGSWREVYVVERMVICAESRQEIKEDFIRKNMELKGIENPCHMEGITDEERLHILLKKDIQGDLKHRLCEIIQSFESDGEVLSWDADSVEIRNVDEVDENT